MKILLHKEAKRSWTKFEVKLIQELNNLTNKLINNLTNKCILTYKL